MGEDDQFTRPVGRRHSSAQDANDSENGKVAPWLQLFPPGLRALLGLKWTEEPDRDTGTNFGANFFVNLTQGTCICNLFVVYCGRLLKIRINLCLLAGAFKNVNLLNL